PAASDIDEESEAILEELEEELLEEELLGEDEPEELLGEDEPEEQLQQAARPKKKSVAMAILDRSKYLGIGIVFAGIAFGLFFKKRKKPEASTEIIPAPEKIQQVEERSQRLEHALEVIDQQPAATEPIEDTSDDEPLGFSEVPIPGKEEKPE
ncbi:MAG: hypothetical protein O3A81_04310, partial [bacterium]|nr:hypothetical protein [bacterium]